MKMRLHAWYNGLTFLWLMPGKIPPTKDWERAKEQDKDINIDDSSLRIQKETVAKSILSEVNDEVEAGYFFGEFQDTASKERFRKVFTH